MRSGEEKLLMGFLEFSKEVRAVQNAMGTNSPAATEIQLAYCDFRPHLFPFLHYPWKEIANELVKRGLLKKSYRKIDATILVHSRDREDVQGQTWTVTQWQLSNEGYEYLVSLKNKRH